MHFEVVQTFKFPIHVFQICAAECNAKKSLDLHCGGMKHLKVTVSVMEELGLLCNHSFYLHRRNLGGLLYPILVFVVSLTSVQTPPPTKTWLLITVPPQSHQTFGFNII